MPASTSCLTTEMARPVDSSQLDGNLGVEIGITSVWPSTRSTQLISLGILTEISLKVLANWAI